MVTIVDPHIKKDDGYFVYHEAKEKDYFIKNKHGNEYDGWCWPGSSSYLDYSNPAVWNWWANNFALDRYQGKFDDSGDKFVSRLCWGLVNDDATVLRPCKVRLWICTRGTT